MVERGEVVEVVLDLGTLRHPVPEPDEDVLDLPAGATDHVQVAGDDRRRAGEGDVDPLRGQRAIEVGALELARPRGDLGLERLTGGVGGGADGSPLVRVEVGNTAQNPGQLRLAAEVSDPQLLERGGVRRRADRRRCLVAQVRDSVNHVHLRRRPTISARARSPPPRRR
jgi:hypothetical protein